MNSFKILIFCLIAVLVFWDLAWWALGVKPLLPWRLKRALRERPDAYQLIDARTSSEYQWFHIPGVRNFPALLANPKGLKVKDPEQPIVVICMSGHRSSIVAYRLKKSGSKNVYNLTWGMLGWVLSGGATTKGEAWCRVRGIPCIIVTCPRPFASDIEHFWNQTAVERSVKNHKLFEGLKARVFVI